MWWLVLGITLYYLYGFWCVSHCIFTLTSVSLLYKLPISLHLFMHILLKCLTIGVVSWYQIQPIILLLRVVQYRKQATNATCLVSLSFYILDLDRFFCDDNQVGLLHVEVYWSHVASHLVVVVVVLVLLVGVTFYKKALRLRRFKAEWHECSSSECASIDGVGLRIWRHTFDMAAMTS